MRAAIALVIAFLVCGWTHGWQVLTTDDIVATYGATCNGTADDTAAWNSFLTARQGASVQLNIPFGKTCCILSTVGSGNNLAKGVTFLRVVGYGASITNSCGGTTGNFYSLGAGGVWGCTNGCGIAQNNTTNALVQTVGAGVKSVTLVTAAQNSRFTVNQWAMLGGSDLQGAGAPPNLQFFEYVYITNINAGTGVITFRDPLSNKYESTWPSYSSNTWQGGPATLYALNPEWGGSVEWRGVTFTMKQGDGTTDQQIACPGFSCLLEDVTMVGVGNACVYPSQNFNFYYINVKGTATSTTGCGVEMDKLVQNVVMTKSTFNNVHFQSSAINNLVETGNTINGQQTGTPGVSSLVNNTISDNSSTGIALLLGATSFGVSTSVHLAGNTLAHPATDTGATYANVDSVWTMSGGVMSRSLAAIQADITGGGTPINWAAPGKGGYFQLNASPFTQYPFTVTDVGTSGANVTITLNCASCTGGMFPASGLSAHAASPVHN